MLKIKARINFLKILFLIFLSACGADAKSYTQCELSEELLTVHNVTINDARNLVCIAQKFSRLNTNVVVGERYGIFQINEKFCGHKKAGGECKIKCHSLLDDDISDDAKCAQEVIARLGLSVAWRIEKTQGCQKELKNLEENCSLGDHGNNQNNNNNDDAANRDHCEYARKLVASYGISKLDAVTWSCIAKHRSPKTGNVNSKLAAGGDEDAACVFKHDVECSIKNQKLRSSSGFTIWPEYEEFCANLSENDEIAKKCFSFDESESDDRKTLKIFASPTTERQHFTTSTDISVIVEEDAPKVTTEAQPTTEFLSKTIEKPASDEQDIMVEGYSKVRVMFSDASVIEPTEELTTTAEKISEEIFKESLKCHFTRNFVQSRSIPQNLIATFVCIAEHESHFNVSLITTSEKSRKYGLFQIDNAQYCNTNEKINICDTLCEHLTDDQYDNDLDCALKVHETAGFDYWPSYAQHCQQVSQSLVEDCHETHSTTHQPYTIVNYELLKKKVLEELTSTTTTTTFVDALNDEEQRIATTPVLVGESQSVVRQFDVCEFSQELNVNQRIELNKLNDFVCIADLMTKLRVQKNSESTDKIGIFGLKSDSCGENAEIGGRCSASCLSFFDESLTEVVKCASKIYESESLSYWNLTDEICKPYSNKILKCIHKGTFVPTEGIDSDDEDEFDVINFGDLNESSTESTAEENSTKIDEEETSTEELTTKGVNDEIFHQSTADQENLDELLTNVASDDADETTAQPLAAGIDIDQEILAQLNKTSENIIKHNEQNLTSLISDFLESIVQTSELPQQLDSETVSEPSESDDVIEEIAVKLEEKLKVKQELAENSNVDLTFDVDETTAQPLATQIVIEEEILAQLNKTIENVLKHFKQNFTSEEEISDFLESEVQTSELPQQLDSETVLEPSESEDLIEEITVKLEEKLKVKQELTENSNVDLIFDATERSESKETNEQSDELLSSSVNLDVLSSKANKTFESERDENSTLVSTTESLYYTSVQEIIDDLEDKNLIKRETTLFPESGEDNETTTENDNDVDVVYVFKPTYPPPSEGHIEKCALARYMRESTKIPLNLVSPLMCIAEHESNLNISLIRSEGGKTRYTRYGLFQIDDVNYCNTNQKINKCDVICPHLVDDQLDNDLQCVMDIYRREGLEYWPSYNKHCKDAKSIDYLSMCREVFTTTHYPYTFYDRELAIQNIFTTTTTSATTTTVPTTTVYIPKANYTDDDGRFVIRRFDDCELTNEIYQNNVTIDEVSKLVCVGDLKSGLKIRKPNEDEMHIGIFSINNTFCGEGGVCGIECSQLLDDDITDDILCAKIILESDEVSAWKLSEEECKPYGAKLLECADEGHVQTTKDPENAEITPWSGFSYTTAASPMTKEPFSYKPNKYVYFEDYYTPATTKYTTPHDLGDLDFLAVLTSENPLPTRSTTTEQTTSTTTSSEKPVTLSAFLEPPHLSTASDDDEIVEVKTEASVKHIDSEPNASEDIELTTTSITEEELKRIVKDVIAPPQQVLFLPKEKFADEIEEEFEIEKLRSEETTELSETETTTVTSRIDTKNNEESNEVPETGESTEKPLQKDLESGKIISLHQSLLPPHDTVAITEEETEKPEFKIIVESGEINSAEDVVKENKSSEAVTLSSESLLMHESVGSDEQTSESSSKNADEVSTTAIPETTPSSSTIPYFRLKSRTTTEAPATTQTHQDFKEQNIQNSAEEVEITLTTASTETAIETTTEKEVISSRIIGTLMTAATSEAPESSEDDNDEPKIPQIILNDQNLTNQVKSILKAHSGTKNSTKPIVFNIFNFNIAGQNHEINYAIDGNKQKQPQKP